jgi:polar amino acid transport system substrate-binding protein
MISKRRCLKGLLLATTFGVSATASAQTPNAIKAKGVIRVGMLVDFPPFGFMNAQGQPDGFDADVAKALAGHMGVKLDIVQVTGPNRIPYLLTNKVDLVVASLGITEERKKVVAFSKPYAAMLNVVYGNKGLAVAKPADLAGHSAGVTRASVQETALMQVAPAGTKVQRYDDDASAVQALLSGQVELIGVDTVTILDIDKRAPGKFDTKFELTAQVQGIAVRPADKALLEYVNAFLDTMKSSGNLGKIHEKWFHQPLPKVVSE